MVLALLLGGVALLALPALTRRGGRQLPPAEWAKLSTASLLVGALFVELSFLLLAAPTVLRSAHVHGWAIACEKVLGPLVPGGAAAGWAALLVGLGLPAATAVMVLRARRGVQRCRAPESLGEHARYGAHELVVLPTEAPLAVTVGGRTPQILVSEGIVGELDPEHLEMVLRHEAAHIELGHHSYLLFLAGLEGAFAWVPGARGSVRAVRAALERWADEAAVGGDDQRRVTVREALLQVTLVAVGPAIASFSATDSLMERLEALSSRPSPPSRLGRAATYCPVGLLGLGLVLAMGVWMGQASGVLGAAGHCPI